jgi:hypothetical protein
MSEHSGRRSSLGAVSSVVCLAALAALASCAAAAPQESRSRSLANTAVPREPPRRIIVRTTSFAFHMGAHVDESWPSKAEETRAVLGQMLTVLLDEEDATVPVLARQLGVTWPDTGLDDALDFDVELEASASCDSNMPRVLGVARGGEPRVFFGCVLARAFVRLEHESAVYRGLVKTGGVSATRAVPADEQLYACIVTYAVSAVLVARAQDKAEARAVERGLAAACDRRALDWMAAEWIKRVREDESPQAFGARAADAMRAAHGATPAPPER